MLASLLLALASFQQDEFREAVERGRLKDVERLLEARPELLKETDREGRSPLHFAWTRDMAELLLSKGADLHASDKGGRTLLYNWVKNAREPAQIEFLLARGADPNQAPEKHSLLWIALSNRAEETALLLLKDKARIDHTLGNQTTLHVAAQQGAAKVVRLALEARVPVQGAPGEFTPLHYAAGRGDVEILRLLADAGADVQAVTAGGHRFIGGINRDFNGRYTPLLLAAAGGHLDALRYLLEKGAPPRVRDAFGSTPLHHAARLGKSEIVNALLDAKADVNDLPPPRNGFCLSAWIPWFGSPLHLAAEGGHLDAATVLVNGGAKVDLQDGAGRTPLHRLLDDLDYGLLLGAHEIHQAGGPPHSAEKAKRGDRERLLRFLIARGADVNAKDRQGVTALRLILDSGNPQAAKILREAGATE